MSDSVEELVRLHVELNGQRVAIGLNPQAWAVMLTAGADSIRESERMLKQAYTDRMNEGMAFGL